MFLSFYNFFFFIYLENRREWDREGNWRGTKRDLNIHRFTTKMPAIAKAWLSWSQEPGSQSRIPYKNSRDPVNRVSGYCFLGYTLAGRGSWSWKLNPGTIIWDAGISHNISKLLFLKFNLFIWKKVIERKKETDIFQLLVLSPNGLTSQD